tara:strand:- start:4270 stop:4761 length:492 start_codon:yes stop_codon:yes gene_type:complete
MRASKKRKVPRNSHSKLYIGIDPGKSGAIASLNSHMKAWKCPDNANDMHRLFELITYGVSGAEIKVVMEKVWARPNNASRAAFNYGVNYGQWLGVMAGFEIEPELMLPANWMKFYGMKKGMEYKDRKKWLKAKAQELYPKLKVTLTNADAILIAHYLKERDVH